MKNFTLFLFCFTTAILFSGCGLVEDAFKAGIFFTIIIVVIIGLIVWLSRIVISQAVKRHQIKLNAR